MDSASRAWLWFGAFCVFVVFGMPTGCAGLSHLAEYRTQVMIAEAISAGTDPLAARCALRRNPLLDDGNGLKPHQLDCVLFAAGRKVAP